MKPAISNQVREQYASDFHHRYIEWSICYPTLLSRLHWVDGRGTCVEYVDPQTGERVNPSERGLVDQLRAEQ